jgi:hypothetical protein
VSYQKLLKNYVLNQLHRRPPKSAKKKYLLRALKVRIHACLNACSGADMEESFSDIAMRAIAGAIALHLLWLLWFCCK